MAKRGNGEGVIYQRNEDGRWVVRLRYGRDEKGKPQRITKYANTRAEAQQILQALQAELKQRRTLKRSGLSVEAWVVKWIDNNHDLRPPTRFRYKSLLRCHIAPHIGRVQVAKLTALQVVELYKTILSKPRGSLSTCRHVHALLRAALKWGVKLKEIPANVCDDVDRPKPPDKPANYLSDEDALRFLAAASDDRLQALYLLAVVGGFRQGELFALHWSDVDWRRSTVTIQRNLQELNGQLRTLA